MAYAFFTFVFIVVSYISGVFLAPNITRGVEGAVGLSGATDSIRGFKDGFDDVITDIPSAQEFKSGAIDIGNTVKGSLDTTKSKIDDVRTTLSGAQDTINNTFDAIDSTIETVKTAKESVQNFNESNEGLMKIGDSIMGTVNTDDVGNVSGN